MPPLAARGRCRRRSPALAVLRRLVEEHLKALRRRSEAEASVDQCARVEGQILQGAADSLRHLPAGKVDVAPQAGSERSENPSHLPRFQAGVDDLIGACLRIGGRRNGLEDRLADKTSDRVVDLGTRLPSHNDLRPPNADHPDQVRLPLRPGPPTVQFVPNLERLLRRHLKARLAKGKLPRRVCPGGAQPGEGRMRPIGQRQLAWRGSLDVAPIEDFHGSQITVVTGKSR